jgi:NAD-dependent SIR2 family protein deacetylase
MAKPHVQTQVADLVQALDSATNVLVLVGAGISVNAGIPDFRSPTHGIYAKYNCDPEDVFHIESFRDDPIPLYRLVADLLVDTDGNMLEFTPTVTHKFLRKLRDSGKLLRVYSQNIDGLDCEPVGLHPDTDVIQCHGNLRTIRCSNCGREQPSMTIQSWTLDVVNYLRHQESSCHAPVSSTLQCSRCGGYLKPSVVLFGEQLPADFFLKINRDTQLCDLLIVLGSSLTVFPFAAIPSLLPPGVPQFVVAKHLTRQPRGAHVISEDCDVVVTELSKRFMI